MAFGFQKKAGVLLDLDGTLIDSMSLHYRCWSEILDRFGVSIDVDHFMLQKAQKLLI